jgi:hypothetical protein
MPVAEQWMAGGFECGTGVKSELQTLLSAFLRRRAALPKRSFNSSAAGGMLSRDFSPTHAAGAERVVGGEPAGAACGLGVMQSQAQVEMDSQLLFLQEAARAKRLKLSKELTKSAPNLILLYPPDTTVCLLQTPPDTVN